jgi:hypothetical protein
MENPTSYPVTGASEAGAVTSNVVPQPPPAQPRPPSVNPVGVPGTFKTGATGATGTTGATGAGAGTAGATGARTTGAGATLGELEAVGAGLTVGSGVAVADGVGVVGGEVVALEGVGATVVSCDEVLLPVVTDAVTSTAGTAMAETTTTPAAEVTRILIKVVEARNQAITSAPQRLIGFSMPAGDHV